MADINTVVKSVIDTLIKDSKAFTAIDVSNKVKEIMPAFDDDRPVRHRDISPIVRKAYTNGEMGDYDRTLIKIKKENGEADNSYLYHALNDTWDLDVKYDDVRRAQSATPPKVAAPVPVQNDTSQPIKVDVVADAAKTKNALKKAKAQYSAPQILPPTIWDDAINRVKRKLFYGW